MTAKEYLNQARLLDQRINAKLDRVTRLRALTERVTAAMDGEVVSHTRNVMSLQDQIARLMDEEESLNAAIDRLVDLKAEIHGVICEVPDQNQQMLLRHRYIHLRSWEEIEYEMDIRHRWVHTLHARALRSVEEILDRKGIPFDRESSK